MNDRGDVVDAGVFKDRRVRNFTIASACALAGLFFPVHAFYVNWHAVQAREIVKEEVAKIQSSITLAQNTADASADKIDFLIKAEAARNVEDLNTRLVLLKAQDNPPPHIRAEIAALEYKVQKAVVYRDCVINDRPNCDALRVW